MVTESCETGATNGLLKDQVTYKKSLCIRNFTDASRHYPQHMHLYEYTSGYSFNPPTHMACMCCSVVFRAIMDMYCMSVEV